jgi:hypothetical protein
MANRVLSELASCIAARRLLGLFALHWGPLDEACSSVKTDEARKRIWLIPT